MSGKGWSLRLRIVTCAARSDWSLALLEVAGIDDERPRFAHFRDCGRRVFRPQIDAPAGVFNHGGPNA